ncbi:MAG: NAD(+) diphosphatase [Treponema sp.]|nr:NAD(+) diphosphatase [Treponema sp.]
MNYYIFQDKNILVQAGPHSLPDAAVWKRFSDSKTFNDTFTEDIYSYTASSLQNGNNVELPSGYEFIPLRQYFAENSDDDGTRAGRASALLSWRSAYAFCPACGALLKDDEHLAARNCKKCGRQYFPRIEPCIIVLITRGKELLLARHKMRNQDIYTCIAGFIETGESAEQAVVREVHEEVGLEIQNLRYVGSQGWPFPDQLMLGYRAEYKSGEVHVQESELYEAKWFTRDALPSFPKAGSMGWRLISGMYD